MVAGEVDRTERLYPGGSSPHRPIVLPIITANNKTKKNGSQSAIGFGSATRCRDVGEGRCSVIVTGKRSARNVYANSVGECEAKPAETVQEIKAEFAGNGVKIALRLTKISGEAPVALLFSCCNSVSGSCQAVSVSNNGTSGTREKDFNSTPTWKLR